MRACCQTTRMPRRARSHGCSRHSVRSSRREGTSLSPPGSSTQEICDTTEDRGVEVDHSTLNRWVLKYVPLLDKGFVAHKRQVSNNWRLDETYVRIKEKWKYLYRAVDKAGATVDFLLTARRDRKAALRFLHKAMGRHGLPAKITIDRSGANATAIESYNADHDAEIETRQVKYLNNIVEQDHRAIKRMRPMLGFKSFWSAAITIAGIEIMHMIRKGQMRSRGMLRPAEQFYPLAECRNYHRNRLILLRYQSEIQRKSPQSPRA
jgi:putative transposase